MLWTVCFSTDWVRYKRYNYGKEFYLAFQCVKRRFMND